jgi:hypothetical protein
MNDIQRLERIYGAAGRELRRILSLEPGVARVRAREIVKVLNMAVDKWANGAIPRAYAKGERRTRTSLEILGRKRRHPPVEDRPRRLIDDLMILLLRANNSIPVTVDRYLAAAAMASRTVGAARVREFSFNQAASDVGRLAAEAELKEKSRGWLSKQVRDFLRTLIEDDEFIEINGRMYRMNKYAELVARTAMRESQTAATLDLCRQYENDLVQWSDHGTVCEICIQFEDKIYSISGTSLDYPMLEEEPPAHPNCQHVLLATSEEGIALERTRGESDLAKQIREGQEAVEWRNVR